MFGSLPAVAPGEVVQIDPTPLDVLTPAAVSALHKLAAITGTSAPALARALPVFGGGPAGPARATLACRRCAAARGIYRLVPVHLPARSDQLARVARTSRPCAARQSMRDPWPA